MYVKRVGISLYPVAIDQAKEIQTIRGIGQFSDLLSRLIEEEHNRRLPDIVKMRDQNEKGQDLDKMVAGLVAKSLKKQLPVVQTKVAGEVLVEGGEARSDKRTTRPRKDKAEKQSSSKAH